VIGMKTYFDDDCVLHVVPENTSDTMAMRYFEQEFAKHGPRMIELHTEIPGNAKPRKAPVQDDDDD